MDRSQERHRASRVLGGGALSCTLWIASALIASGCSLLGLGSDDEGAADAAVAAASETPAAPADNQAGAPSDLVPNPTPPTPPPVEPPPPAPPVDPSAVAPGTLPPGVDPSQLPPGFDPTKLQPGVDPSQLPPGFDPSKLPPGVDPSQLPPGFDPSKLPAGMDPSQLPPGIDPSKLPPGGLPPGVPPDALAKLQKLRDTRRQLTGQINRLNHIIDANKTRDPADVVRLNRYILARREIDGHLRQIERQFEEAGIPMPPDQPAGASPGAPGDSSSNE